MCGNVCMATNLNLDSALVQEALAVGGLRTKKETVTVALREFIDRRRQAKVTSLFSTVDFDPTYDYKAQRRRR
jgi:Arc/MetJ family transcription regulator